MALLYLGDLAAVEMLLKRTPPQQDALFQDWASVVAMPMMQRDAVRALQGLQHVSTSSPPPFNQYASEIASVYLQRQEQAKSGVGGSVKRKNYSNVGQVVAFLESAV